MIELYEKYRLRDGRTGRAVEILGDGEACIFEVDQKSFEGKVITVFETEIEGETKANCSMVEQES
ncbi:MAG: hypothetical protein Q4P26_08675 [Lachnospiraceae bacterium]|nr:hypothetical protein [Lachnospiraceae bacterium]